METSVFTAWRKYCNLRVTEAIISNGSGNFVSTSASQNKKMTHYLLPED